MSFVKAHVLPAVGALAAGVVVGIAGPLLGMSGDPVSHVASIVLSAGWAWAALAFCVGLTQRGKVQAAVLAPASLLVAVNAYYLTWMGQGRFQAADLSDRSGRMAFFDWGGFLSMTGFWSVCALVLGPLLGLAGNLARNRGFRGLPFQVLIPLIAIVDTSQRLRFEAPLTGPAATTTWTVIRLVAVAGILALSLLAWWSRPSVRMPPA